MKNLTKLYQTVSVSFYKISCQTLEDFEFARKKVKLNIYENNYLQDSRSALQ